MGPPDLEPGAAVMPALYASISAIYLVHKEILFLKKNL
jgi:hypothetical protein